MMKASAVVSSRQAGATLPRTATDSSAGRIPQTRAAVLEVSRVFDAEALTRAMNRLADSGWNSVILQGFFEGYPIFPSQVWADYGLRRRHPKFRKWNPFEVAIDIAWRRRIDLTISITPYLIGSGGSRRRPTIQRHYPKWTAVRHPSRKQRLSQAHPAQSFYCPVNREFRRFLCDTLYAMLEDYPIHGVLIDLRHYPFYSSGEGDHALWCYCEACREATLTDLGFDPAGVDLAKERPMIERWKEWQAAQMDKALAYFRQRMLKARRTMRVYGLLTTDSGLSDKLPRPLIHWKTWVERALVEALVLDGYSPQANRLVSQIADDIETLPDDSLLLPMLPRKVDDGQVFLRAMEREPIPGFTTRFDDWDQADFDPTERLVFDAGAFSVESDPIQSICILFEEMARRTASNEEFSAFLRDLSHILTRADRLMNVDRLLMVAENVRGLYNKAKQGELILGAERDYVVQNLDITSRLTYLALCDLME